MESIGSYKVLGQLGSGGMGTVYLAEHRFLKRKSAIKVLLADLVNRPDLLERFFAEARATSQLEHPGIVRIFDCEVDAQGGRMRPYFVMELIEGETLAVYQRRCGRLPVNEAAGYARAIADALAAAHERGIVHRDLKPDNVFVRPGPAPAVKLVDFGIAKLAGEFRAASVARTQTGMIMGTPPYMSPEQCRGVGAIDHRTDIYALGCVLFEMVCGVTPFVRDSTGGFLVAHITQVPPTAQSINALVPAPLSDLIAAMLAKAPEERPASMREVVERLAVFVPSGVGLAGAVTVKQVVDSASGPRAATPAAVSSPAAAERMKTPAAAAPPVAPAPAPLAGLVTPVVGPRAADPTPPPPAMHTTLRATAGELAAETSAALAEVVAPARRRRQLVVAGAGALAVLVVVGSWALGKRTPPVAEDRAPLPAIAAAGFGTPAPSPPGPSPASPPPSAAKPRVPGGAIAPGTRPAPSAGPAGAPSAAVPPLAGARVAAAAAGAPGATTSSRVPAAPTPSSVVVEIQSNPTGAAICFDGDRRLITVTHGAVQLPYDPREVTFVLYLPGYEPAPLTVRSNRNSKRTVTLRPSPPGVVRPPACDY